MALFGRVYRGTRIWKGCNQRGMASLAYETVGDENGADSKRLKTAIVIHGLMGAGKNLRTLAKQLNNTLMERDPSSSAGWRFILVDLRNHGNSASLEHLKPPHNIRSAARDIAELVESESWKWPDVVMGHSLGGKVALEFGESCAKGYYGSSAVLPKQFWILDSVPGKIDIHQSGDVERVLKTIQGFPNPIPSRSWLLEQLDKEGFSKTLGQWLASNVKRIDPSSEKMTWIFDIEGIQDMYLSYKQDEYWSFLETPPKGTNIGIIRAKRSDRWFPEVLSQLEKLVEDGREPRSQYGTVSYHVLEGAGHWLHVDNPGGLVEILLPSFLTLSCE